MKILHCDLLETVCIKNDIFNMYIDIQEVSVSLLSIDYIHDDLLWLDLALGIQNMIEETVCKLFVKLFLGVIQN